MANSNSRYKEKNNPILSVLYVIVVLVLVAALIFMYKIYRDKRNAYKLLVQSASETDAGYDIAARKADIDASGELEDEPDMTAVTLAPTAEPTAEPTAVPTPEVTAEPEPTAVPETPTEAPAAYIPETEQDALVDESLAQGIDGN